MQPPDLVIDRRLPATTGAAVGTVVQEEPWYPEQEAKM